MHVSFVPPVEFGDVVDPRGCEPLLVAEGHEEMRVRMAFFDRRDGGVVHVVVVVVGYYYGVDGCIPSQ